MYGQKVMGIPRDKVDPNNQNGCILPNAAIGWKQPNGFYYPPRFHSENLFFRNVDIRHFLIEPLFTPGTMNVDVAQVEQDYCKYPPGDSSQLFSASFTDVDRQTELNDDDGSLSGNVASISLNKDSFYTTPIEEIECMSAQSSKQVPYDFVTTAIYPYCRDTCFDPTTSQWWWSSVCQDRSCAGLPIYRQYYTTDEGGAKDAQKIQMMGAGIGQRSTLTAWLGDATKDPIYGKYYIQTNAQDDSMFKTNFQTGKNYYVFLLYTKPETKMQYQIYVGSGAGQDYLTSGVQMVRVGTKTGDPQVTLLNLPLQFAPGAWPSAWTKTYDSGTGILTVTVDMSAFKDDFTKGFQEFCGPSDYCTLDAGNTNCVCTDKAKAQGCYDDICAWAMTKALDCPSGGCLGFSFTLLGDDAHPGTKFEFDKDFRPAPEPYPASWVSAKFNPAGSKDLAGCCYQYDPNNPPVSPTCDWTQSGAGLDWLK
jgi:hypothetical protein